MNHTIKSWMSGLRNAFFLPLFLLLFLPLFLQCKGALAGVVIIGNPSNSNHLTEDQVTKVYLGKLHEFQDGTSVKAVDQAEGQIARQEFLSKFLHKDERSLKSYWSLIVFTGNGAPPETLPDNHAVKKFVSSNPNAIGYIDSKEIDSSVKVMISEKE